MTRATKATRVAGAYPAPWVPDARTNPPTITVPMIRFIPWLSFWSRYPQSSKNMASVGLRGSNMGVSLIAR
jgi:hypothetical protein